MDLELVARLAAIALALLALTYLALCAAAYAGSRALIFLPTVLDADEALAQAARAGLEPWIDERGQRIGWRRANPGAGARLVVFHGNAGTAIDRAFYAALFGDALETLLFEYPGYGDRAGTPSRAAFLAAAGAALDTLGTDRPVYLLGESIGSGTAAAMAGARGARVAGVVLMIPFARLSDVAARVVPWLPVRWLLRDDFDNVAALADYPGPVAVVVAERDEVVGADQGRALFAALRGTQRLVMMPRAGHNDFPARPGAPWAREVLAFLGPPPTMRP